mmetsp:Transcript_6904/g.14349  ORF Transcript_6904/g.14349 Transcript_6904/m.14349 type:complete len:323 (-) Transcript_6904:262-1230(-)
MLNSLLHSSALPLKPMRPANVRISCSLSEPSPSASQARKTAVPSSRRDTDGKAAAGASSSGPTSGAVAGVDDIVPAVQALPTTLAGPLGPEESKASATTPAPTPVEAAVPNSGSGASTTSCTCSPAPSHCFGGLSLASFANCLTISRSSSSVQYCPSSESSSTKLTKSPWLTPTTGLSLFSVQSSLYSSAHSLSDPSKPVSFAKVLISSSRKWPSPSASKAMKSSWMSAKRSDARGASGAEGAECGTLALTGTAGAEAAAAGAAGAGVGTGTAAATAAAAAATGTAVTGAGTGAAGGVATVAWNAPALCRSTNMARRSSSEQ